MKLGWRGERLIKEFEQCRLKAYAATAEERARGIWTIGWGHTHGVTEGMTCTQEQADAWFLEDVATYEHAVNVVGVPLTQAMFDALVSITYNAGTKLLNADKVIGGALRARNYVGAKVGFAQYRLQAGKVLEGLVRRRKREQELFMADGLPENV